MKLDVERSVKVKIELTEEEALGLYTLMNYGVTSNTLRQLALYDLTLELAGSKELKPPKSSSYFRAKAAL